MSSVPLALPSLTTHEVLLVSSAVTPPWRNGSVVLTRDLALGGERYRYSVLGSRGQIGFPGSASRVEGFYVPEQSSFLRNLRLAARLVRTDASRIQHFFFAPHPRTSSVARWALRLNRKKSVHTLPSLPAPATDIASLMFADRIVTVSEASGLFLRSAGIEDVRVIRPGIPLPENLPSRLDVRHSLARRGVTSVSDGPTFLYAGDLEFSNGAEIFAKAAVEMHRSSPESRFLFACRPKTPASSAALERVRNILRQGEIESHCQMLGTVSDMPALLRAVDAVVMPVDTLFAKVDIPLVLLEAMAVGTPLVVSDLGSLTELAGLGGGASVIPHSNHEACAEEMLELADNVQKRERMGRAARSSIALNFRPADMVRRYEALYDELL